MFEMVDFKYCLIKWVKLFLRRDCKINIYKVVMFVFIIYLRELVI